MHPSRLRVRMLVPLYHTSEDFRPKQSSFRMCCVWRGAALVVDDCRLVQHLLYLTSPVHIPLASCVICCCPAVRIINLFGAGVAGADAVCMALMAISALAWQGTSRATTATSVVMLLQFSVFCGEWLEEVNSEVCVHACSVSLRC